MESLILNNLHSRRADGAVLSLDGTWAFIPDPYQTGLYDITGELSSRGYFRDFSPRHPGDRVEYDFDRSPTLEVPGDWNTQRPELLLYEGLLWYRRIVELDAGASQLDTGSVTYLHVGAANHTTRVYVNGRAAGHHVGGFGPWAVDVTGMLRAGSNSIVIAVDNRREPDRIPAMRTDWYNFGGLHRSVELVTLPAGHLRDAWLTMAADGSLLAGATATVDGEVSVQLAGRQVGTIAVTAGAPATASFGVDAAAGLDRWHPGAPVLHELTFELQGSTGESLDRIDDEVGLRTIRTEGATILVNDRPVWLRGISMHAEGPTGGRRAHGDADAAELFDWADGLGVNFVRLSHYQHDEAMVREADRRGLLVWCELPVYWGIDFGNDEVLANAVQQTDELVVRDRSRAAVGLWSVANETLPGPDRNRFLGALADRVRELDPTRLVTAALLTLPSNDPTVHIEDPLGEHVDVIGVNQYLGWYYGSREDIAGTQWTSVFGKPIVFSELGAGAKAGHHGEENEIWTEEFQAAVYREQIAMISAQTECAGMSPWILKDFRTPMRVLPGIQDGYNRKGVVSEEGERKLAYDVLADFYRRTPEAGPAGDS